MIKPEQITDEEILARLHSGQTLRLNDQLMILLSYEDGRYITRAIYVVEERKALSEGREPDYEVVEHTGILSAFLAVLDYRWEESGH